MSDICEIENFPQQTLNIALYHANWKQTWSTLQIHSKPPYYCFLQGTMVRWSVMDTKINAFSFQKAVGLSFLHISYCLEAPTTIGVTHTSRSWKIYLLTETRHLNKLFPSITNSFQWRQLVEGAFRKYLHQNWGTLISWCWGRKRNVSAVEGRSLTLSWQILCLDCK